jgi:hypothetical protein
MTRASRLTSGAWGNAPAAASGALPQAHNNQPPKGGQK